MTSLPRLTEADVRRWAGDTSVQRGRPYVSDALFDQRRMGRTLKSSCEGSAATPYYIQATLGDDGVEHAHCSCPVGSGRCKHVAALLLAWVEEPEQFVELEETGAVLARHSKAELIDLVRQMIARYPDLELLLEHAPAGADGPNERVLRRQIETVLRAAEAGWNAGSVATERLAPLVALGRSYLGGNPAAAIAVFEVVARTILERYRHLSDDDGALLAVVEDCAGGLAECLAAETDAARRERVLRALFDLMRWDVEYGGTGLGDMAAASILAHARPSEGARVATWTRAALPQRSAYQQEALSRFLLELERETLDDEAFLRMCAETGRSEDLVARLLELGRIAEALDVVASAAGAELLALADVLRDHGREQIAVRLVEEHARRRPDFELLAWLKQRAVDREDFAAAALLAEQLFRTFPSLAAHAELRELARRAGMLEQLLPPLATFLEQSGRSGLLLDILLADGEVHTALGMRQIASDEQRIRLAQAAEPEFPREASSLYGQAVEQLIALRSRNAYALAAGYLATIGELARRTGDEVAWRALVRRLRREHRRLRAFQEELTKAGVPEIEEP